MKIITVIGARPRFIKAAEEELSPKKLDFSMNLYGDGYAGDKVVKMIIG